MKVLLNLRKLFMKIIKRFLISALLSANFCLAHAQISQFIVDQIIEQIVGSIVDNIAESLGRDAGQSYTSNSKNTDNDASLTLNKEAFAVRMECLEKDAVVSAYNALNEGGEPDLDAATNAPRDLIGTYKGNFIDQNVEQCLRSNIEHNYQKADALADASKSLGSYLSTLNLESILTTKAFNIWNERSHSSEELRRLYIDISNNLELLYLFQNIPTSIGLYSKIEHNALKRNINWLYYLSVCSERYERILDSLAINNIHAIDLNYANNNGKVVIRNKTNETLCFVTDMKDGFSFDCRNSSILGLYPSKSSRYVLAGKTWATDSRSRPVYASIELSEEVDPTKKDKTKAKAYSILKLYYNSLANPVFVDNPKRKALFYLIPLELSGDDEPINCVMVEKNMIRSSSLKAINKKIKKALKNGKSVKRTVRLKYGDNMSLSPTSITIETTCDGVIDTVVLSQ